MQNILKYYHKMVAYDFKSGSDLPGLQKASFFDIVNL